MKMLWYLAVVIMLLAVIILDHSNVDDIAWVKYLLMALIGISISGIIMLPILDLMKPTGEK